MGRQPRGEWRELASEIAKRLPRGYLHFRTERLGDDAVAIIAVYRGNAPPPVDPFDVGHRHVTVRTKIVVDALVAPRHFDGVYAGAAIVADLGGGKREYGAICAFVAPPGQPQPTHAVTCGHMFPAGAIGCGVLGGTGNPQPIGTLWQNFLDAADPRDVALVELNGYGQACVANGGPGPKLVDYLPDDQIFGLTCKSYRPTIANYSQATTTAISSTSAHVSSTLRPDGFDLEDVIATIAEVSISGDSGTVLATTDEPIAIGSCSASGGRQSLFEPIGRALDEIIRPHFSLQFWKSPFGPD